MGEQGVPGRVSPGDYGASNRCAWCGGGRPDSRPWRLGGHDVWLHGPCVSPWGLASKSDDLPHAALRQIGSASKSVTDDGLDIPPSLTRCRHCGRPATLGDPVVPCGREGSAGLFHLPCWAAERTKGPLRVPALGPVGDSLEDLT